MKVKIIETTDGKFLGNEVETDFKELYLPNGHVIKITGNLNLDNGFHKVWNSNYIITIRD